jgi:hypothetical protein
LGTLKKTEIENKAEVKGRVSLDKAKEQVKKSEIRSKPQTNNYESVKSILSINPIPVWNSFIIFSC